MTVIPVAVPGTPEAAYQVHVGAGLLDRLPALLPDLVAAPRWAVIADAHVAELYGARLRAGLAGAGLEAHWCLVPAGEWNKTRETWAALTDQMLHAGVGRDGAVLAFGGGVACDLGGFVAATYLRGVPVVQVPTTLLAMIDAAVGGKTAVDVPAGKNLVGAFHPPRAVVADVALLSTLPRSQFCAGMAEALKHGLIADAAYWERLAAGDVTAGRPDLADLVARSVAIKAAIVARDPLERGERAVLNFGHTVGHAIEAAAGYSLLHGEAVAIGMAVEASLAEACGIARGIRAPLVSALERYGLPTAVPGDLESATLMEVMAHDKKVRNAALRFALPAAIGCMARADGGAWTHAIAPETIRQHLDTCR